MQTRLIREESALTVLAEVVLSEMSLKASANVLTLKGDLGAGKTAFTKVLARTLGIMEHITSPTFVIMKSYSVSQHSFIQTLVHIDAYRIEDIDELRVLGFSELLKDPHTLVCIEWPERVLEMIPEDAYPIGITIEEGESRRISYGN